MAMRWADVRAFSRFWALLFLGLGLACALLAALLAGVLSGAYRGGAAVARLGWRAARNAAALRLLAAAPGSRAALARAAPARAVAALTAALPPLSLLDAAWFVTTAAAASVAALSALSLAWRHAALRGALRRCRRVATYALSGAALACAGAEAVDAARDAHGTRLWLVAALRCVAAAGVAAAAARALHPRLLPRVAARRAPLAALAALCAAAATQLVQLRGAHPSERAGVAWCVTALALAAAQLAWRGVLRRRSLLSLARHGAALFANDVSEALSQPPPPLLLAAARFAARAASPTAAAASAAAFAASAAAAAQPGGGRAACAAFAAAAVAQACVAAIMAGGALQRSASPRLARAGAGIEASAARAYSHLDCGCVAASRCLANALLLPALRAVARAARAGLDGLTQLLAAVLRPLAAALRRPVAAVWHSPHASLAASLLVLAAAALLRAHAAQLHAAALVALPPVLHAARAAAARVVAWRAAAAARMLPLLRTPAQAARAAAACARAAAAALDAAFTLGAHASPRFAAAVACLHACTAAVLRLMLRPSEDAPATRVALAAFFARAAGRALLAPLAVAHAGAALGARADGELARLARAAVPLCWAALACALAHEGAQRVRLAPLRAARAAAAAARGTTRGAPVRVDGADACVICLEELACSVAAGASAAHASAPAHADVLALSCGHAFHARCVTEWLESVPPPQQRCPTCRAPAGSSGTAAWRSVLFA
jgi:hypothetical protein